MTELQFKILSHIPFYGTYFKLKNEPMFCSMGVDDGEYDYVLGLITEYKKDHPNEHVTLGLMQQLINEDQQKRQNN